MDAEKLQGLLRTMVPALGGMEVAIEEVSDTSITGSIPFSAFNKNHVGTVYAGVLFSVGEATGGVLLLRNHQDAMILVAEAKISYLKRAESAIKARAEYPAEAKQKLLDEIAENGKARYLLPIDLIDENGVVVARMEINYYLRGQKK